MTQKLGPGFLSFIAPIKIYLIHYSCNEHGLRRLLTIRCADWSVQVTLSIAEAAVNWRLLSKVIWTELCERQEENKRPKYYIRERGETLWDDMKDSVLQ